jgi:hypothetical protein
MEDKMMIEQNKYILSRLILILPLSILCILYVLFEGFYTAACFSQDIRDPIFNQYIELEEKKVWEGTPDALKVHMWAKRYGGLFYKSSANSVQETRDGGYIVAGATAFGAGSTADGWVLKLNSNGSIKWQKSYGPGYNRGAGSICQTSDDGYIMLGPGGIIKLDANGSITWQKGYSGFFKRKIIQTIDQQGNPDGYIVSGSPTGGVERIHLLRLSLNGSAIWQNSYYGSLYRDIQQTIDQTGSPDGYIIAGTWDSLLGPQIPWVMRLNPDRSVVWQKAYKHENPSYIYHSSIKQTFDQQGKPDGYIVAGNIYIESDTFISDCVWVLKLGLDGSIIWQKAYAFKTHSYSYSDNANAIQQTLANAIQQTLDGGYIVLGGTNTGGSSGYDAFILKLSSNGTVEWQKTYGGSGGDTLSSIQQTQDGGYIVAGVTSSFGAPNSDVWVLKLNLNGEIPGCSAMGDIEVIVNDTSVEIEDTNTVPEKFQPSSRILNLLPEDTSAETTEVCVFHETHLNTKIISPILFLLLSDEGDRSISQP